MMKCLSSANFRYEFSLPMVSFLLIQFGIAVSVEVITFLTTLCIGRYCGFYSGFHVLFSHSDLFYVLISRADLQIML